MANRERGEVSVNIAGAPYTLVLNNMAAALAQDALASRRGGEIETPPDIVKKFHQGSELYAIALFWAMLQKHHPAIATLEQASDLLEQAEERGLRVAKAMHQVLGLAFPDVETYRELEALASSLKKKGTPTNRTGGVGKRSTAKRATSA